MQNPPELQGVLFDFNGVLVDDEHLHFESFNAVLAPLHVAIPRAVYDEVYLGFDDRGVFEAVLKAHDLPSDRDRVQALIEAKADVYATRAERELVVFDGAAALVRAVSAVVPTVIVSGALRAEITRALDVMQVRSCVAAVVAAEDVAHCKPDPEGYLLGLEVLRGMQGAVDASACVAIEDSTMGVRAAQTAGLCVVGVAHTYDTTALLEAGADLVAATIGALDVAALRGVAIRRRGELRKRWIST